MSDRDPAFRFNIIISWQGIRLHVSKHGRYGAICLGLFCQVARLFCSGDPSMTNVLFFVLSTTDWTDVFFGKTEPPLIATPGKLTQLPHFLKKEKGEIGHLQLFRGKSRKEIKR
jgi:hypothetical protein